MSFQWCPGVLVKVDSSVRVSRVLAFLFSAEVGRGLIKLQFDDLVYTFD